MHNPGTRAISFLRSPVATLAVLVIALVAQLPHAADVFRLAVAGEGLGATLHSYSYAIALELAVLLFVVQRRNIESYVFAVASICINLAYYALHDVNLLTIDAAPAWLISVALPFAIALYSHLIVDAAHEATHEPVAAPAAPLAEPVAHDEPVQRTRARVQPVQVAEPVDVAPPTIDVRTHALQMHAEGMSVAQIVDALGANPSTVRSWVRRAQQEAA
jgi:DNA-directed RNA polymerase specialized sigma24 family protein